jgi:hypothetical protein
MLRPAMADPEPQDEPAAEADAPPSDTKRERKRRTKEKPAPTRLPGAGTPDGDKLREAVRAFEVGDYARVRARVADLKKAEDPAIRAVAEDLGARIDVDPLQIVVILICALVLAMIVYKWVL